jgi:hypothetical protein
VKAEVRQYANWVSDQAALTPGCIKANLYLTAADGLSLGIAIRAVMKFYKISFLIGFHVSAVVGFFAAIDLAVQGRTGPAITFAILSAVIAMALALWWIVQIAGYAAETREIIKKGVDVISLTSIAVAIAVILRFSIWGESPRAPGHLSMESKILVWDLAPFSFGFIWLLFRYVNVAAERFPRTFRLLFGPPRGLAFYFALIVVGGPLLVLWVSRIGGWLFR